MCGKSNHQTLQFSPVKRTLVELPVVVLSVVVTLVLSVTAQAQDRAARKRTAITIVDAKGHRVESGAPSAASLTFDVTVGPGGSRSFSPSTVNIIAGDTVRWTWEGSGHNVRSGNSCLANGSFCSTSDANCSSSDVSDTGTVYSHTFNQAGTFSYFCSVHCFAGMVGTVVVTDPFVNLSTVVYNGTGFVVSGKTMPNRMVTIQAAPSLLSNFSAIGTATADGFGNFQFTDASASSFGKRFYRAIFP